jgi:hypothetical protein
LPSPGKMLTKWPGVLPAHPLQLKDEDIVLRLMSFLVI